MKLDLLIMEIVVVALIIFSRFSDVLPHPVLWLIFSLFWLAFTGMIFVRSKAKRAVVLLYVKPESVWKTRLSGGVLMLAVSLLVAFPLALMLLLSLLQKTTLFTGLVLLAMPIFMLWLNQLSLLQQHVKAEARFYFQQTFILRVSVLLGILALAIYAIFFQTIPQLTGLNFLQATDYYRQQITIQDEILYFLLSLYAALDGIYLFLLQQLSNTETHRAYQLTAIVFIGFRAAIYSLPMIILVHGISLLTIKSNRQTLEQLVVRR